MVAYSLNLVLPRGIAIQSSLLDLDLKGKTYLITGASSGVGFESARQLVSQGAHVILAVRNIAKTTALAAQHKMDLMRGTYEMRELDLMSFGSVRAFAEGILRDVDHLDVLCNNAGIMCHPKQITKEGCEIQMQVNHFSHFLLTDLLVPLLKKSAPSRIVTLSSSAHDALDLKNFGGKAKISAAGIDLDDLLYERREFVTEKAYQESKLANFLHSRGLAKRLEGTGVTCVSVHPGYVLTGLLTHWFPVPKWVGDWVFGPLLRYVAGHLSVPEGAAAQLHCMLDDSIPANNGAFYSQAGIYSDPTFNKGGWPSLSPNPNAYDDQLLTELWALSRKTVGLAPEVF